MLTWESITYLKKVYPDIIVGYSDHIPPTYGCTALIIAWLMGARILENISHLIKQRPAMTIIMQ